MNSMTADKQGSYKVMIKGNMISWAMSWQETSLPVKVTVSISMEPATVLA